MVQIGLPSIHPEESEAWRSTYQVSGSLRFELENIRAACIHYQDHTNQLIANSEGQADELRGQEVKIKKRIKNLDSAISPWKKVPPEVLAVILGMACDGEIFRLRKRRPWWFGSGLLEHVCFQWRCVALQKRSLYRALRVDYTSGNLDLMKDLTQFAREVLDRGAPTLTISFLGIDTAACRSAGILQALMIDTVETLEITESNIPPDLFADFETQLQSMSALRVLRFDTAGIVHDTRFPVTRGVFCLTTAIPSTPWFNLRELDTGRWGSSLSLSVKNAFRLLSACPSMEICKLTVYSRLGDSDPNADAETVQMKRLSCLTIWMKGDISRTVGPELLDRLVLPSLVDLVLEIPAQPFNIPQSTIF